MQVDIERIDRWTARLGPAGPLRWFQVAFLTVWLCGWFVGECFAGFFVVAKVLSLETSLKAPDAVGIPLSLWLLFWTYGGLTALAQWLRLTLGTDEIEARPDGVTIRWGVGPIRRRRTVAREEVLGVHTTGTKLVLETLRGPVVMTTYGEEEDRIRLANDLRMTLAIDPAAQGEPLVVPGLSGSG